MDNNEKKAWGVIQETYDLRKSEIDMLREIAGEVRDHNSNETTGQIQDAVSSLWNDPSFWHRRYMSVIHALATTTTVTVKGEPPMNLKDLTKDAAISPEMTYEDIVVPGSFLMPSEIYRLSEEKKKFLTSISEGFRNGKEIGDVSDGYHTFNELYHHRAVLFSVICNTYPYLAWKSKNHHDPNEPMYDGMFIVGIDTPYGQATYHYDIDPYWDMFHVREVERAPKWDGHTPDEAIKRIGTIALPSFGEMRCGFTEDCDEYLLPMWKVNGAKYDVHTELFVHTVVADDENYRVPFRYPGATRGHVCFNIKTGAISDVVFYNTAYADTGVACYSSGIEKVRDRWIGATIPALFDELQRLAVTGGVEHVTGGSTNGGTEN